MISLILEDQDFVVETQADLIIASMKDFDTTVILDRLTMIDFRPVLYTIGWLLLGLAVLAFYAFGPGGGSARVQRRVT